MSCLPLTPQASTSPHRWPLSDWIWSRFARILQLCQDFVRTPDLKTIHSPLFSPESCNILSVHLYCPFTGIFSVPNKCLAPRLQTQEFRGMVIICSFQVGPEFCKTRGQSYFIWLLATIVYLSTPWKHGRWRPYFPHICCTSVCTYLRSFHLQALHNYILKIQ